MVITKDFEIGDLVWAKMRCYPFWPAKVVSPPIVKEEVLNSTKGKQKKKYSRPRKGQHYVFFFGSHDHAWILDEKIVPHSEEMLNKVSKKKYASYVKAIEEIVEASDLVVPKPKPVKEDYTERGDLTKNSTAVQKRKKNANTPSVKRVKSLKKSPTIPFVKKNRGRIPKQKIKPVKTRKSRNKKDLIEENRSEGLEKLCRMSDDHPSLISSTPYNANPHVSVIRRFRVDRQYYELPPLPTLNFKGFKYPEIKRKPIKTSKRIGFIGIGMMGQRLVRNLLVTGHDVSVWNRTPDKCKECVSAGAQQLLTPADIVWSCDVIFCCVSGPEAAKSCMYETWGIKHGFEKSEPGSKVYIELTSMDPDTSQEMCAVITDRGGKYLEAPLRGSRSLAEDGLLLALVAGDEMCFKENLPYFSVMCKNAYYVSSNVGDASKMNLALSSLTGTTYASAAEAMTLMECAQIPMNNSVDLCGLNGMKSASLRERCLAISSQDFITEGTLKYQQENMFMALALGSKYNISMGLTATAHEIYKHATLLRYSDHDVSAVYCGAKY